MIGIQAEIGLDVLGGTIVVLDMPPGSAVGMDQYVYTVGDTFCGFKHVPPGTHVLSYAAKGGEVAGFGPVTATFVVMPKVESRGVESVLLSKGMEEWMKNSAMHGPVMCWRWDGREEVLRKVEEEVEFRSIEQAVRGFKLDQKLGSYLTMHRIISCGNFNEMLPSWCGHKQWIGLSKYVNDTVLDRVAPIGGNVCSLAEDEFRVMERGDSDTPLRPSRAERALEDQLRAGRSEEKSGGEAAVQGTGTEGVSAAGHAGKCYFTKIPGLLKRKGLTPEQLTAMNMDKSEAMEQLLQSQYGGDEALMLGEYQFAFLSFLLGHSIDGFLQWKRFLILMLGCEKAVVGARSGLFGRFLECLLKQLYFCLEDRLQESDYMLQQFKKNTSGEALSELLLEDSFLKSSIVDFMQWVLSEQCLLRTEVGKHSDNIVRLLRRRLDWQCLPDPGLPDGAIRVSGLVRQRNRRAKERRVVVVVDVNKD